MSLKKPMVSIIVPIYNAELYLDDCLKSLVNQTMSDIEIVLINDGSLDKSEDICKKYMNEDKRIVYKRIENNGVSNARNIGMDISNADWITFVDSDDWISLDYCEKLFEYVDDEIGMVIGRTVSVINGIVYDDQFHGLKCTYFKSDSDKLILYRSIINDNPKVREYPHLATCSAKLFKKSVIYNYNIRYSSHLKYYEDAVFNIRMIDKSQSVAVTSDILYYYRENDSSSTQKFCSDTVIKYELAATEISELMHSMRLPIQDDYDQFNVKNIDTIFINFFKDKNSIEVQYRFIKDCFNRNVFRESIKRINCRKLYPRRRAIIALNGKLRFYFLILIIYGRNTCI